MKTPVSFRGVERYATSLPGFAVYKHLTPAIGAHRLDRLEPEHLEKVYVRMLEAGRAPVTAHQRTAPCGRR